MANCAAIDKYYESTLGERNVNWEFYDILWNLLGELLNYDFVLGFISRPSDCQEFSDQINPFAVLPLLHNSFMIIIAYSRITFNGLYGNCINFTQALRRVGTAHQVKHSKITDKVKIKVSRSEARWGNKLRASVTQSSLVKLDLLLHSATLIIKGYQINIFVRANQTIGATNYICIFDPTAGKIKAYSLSRGCTHLVIALFIEEKSFHLLRSLTATWILSLL